MRDAPADPFPSIEAYFDQLAIKNQNPDKFTFNAIISALQKLGTSTSLYDFLTFPGKNDDILKFWIKYQNDPRWTKSFVTFQTLTIANLKLGLSSSRSLSLTLTRQNRRRSRQL